MHDFLITWIVAHAVCFVLSLVFIFGMLSNELTIEQKQARWLLATMIFGPVGLVGAVFVLLWRTAFPRVVKEPKAKIPKARVL